jgi:hypothetical protein
MKKTIKLDIPKQLELLCSLLEITPQRVIQGFIDDVSLSQQSNGSDERMMATEYFMRCGHGMHLFDYQEQEQMLEGLNQIRYNFYHFGNDEMAAYKRYAQKEMKTWHNRWDKVKREKTAKGEGQ